MTAPTKLPHTTFPGGHRIHYLDRGCSVLCVDCANEEPPGDRGSFFPFIEWEGDGVYCDKCDKHFDSEHGLIEEDEGDNK